MEKRAVLLLSVILVLILAACGAPEPAAAPTPPPTDTAKANTEVAAATEVTVNIANLAFQPHTIMVATGSTVTWQNDDAVAHTVGNGPDRCQPREPAGRGWPA